MLGNTSFASSIMPRKRARQDDGEYRGDDPSTPDINEAWVEVPEETVEAPAPEQVEAEPEVTVSELEPLVTQEPVTLAPAPEKKEIETDVRKKLERKTDGEDPFVPQNSAQLENEAKRVAKERGFELNRGTSIGARLMARRRLG